MNSAHYIHCGRCILLRRLRTNSKCGHKIGHLPLQKNFPRSYSSLLTLRHNLSEGKRRSNACFGMFQSAYNIYKYPEMTTKQEVSSIPQVEDRYNGVTVDLRDLYYIVDIQEFETILKASMIQWKKEQRSAVWIIVPIEMSEFIPIAASKGFKFHHAEDNICLLKLWLKNTEDKTPRFATHQVGVAGLVYNENTKEVLVVQDKKSNFSYWKFPGGLSNLGEDIGETAVREVFEEVGVTTEFRSVLGVRQQHNQPGAFGRSDFYFVCRLHALTYDLHPCHEEIKMCQWIDLKTLNDSSEITSITCRMTELLLHGVNHGFESVDLKPEEMHSVYRGLKYKLYHRPLTFDK